MRTTGIGSLPHTDPLQAAAFVVDTADIPYLPQLPNRHPEEGMLRQWGDGMCGVGAVDEGIGLRWGEPAGPVGEAFGSADALLSVFEGSTIKTQFTGPVTLGLAMLAAGRPLDGLWDCVVDGLGARLDAHLSRVRRDAPDADVITIMDEPALAIYAPGRPAGPIPIDTAADVMTRVIADAPGPVGVHVCADTDWGMVAGLEPAWLSWDLDALDDGFLSSTAEIALAVAHGTGIMWGMVPTDPAPIDVDRIRSRYGTAVTRLVLEGAPAERLMESSIATPACGLAATTVGGAGAVMDHLTRILEALDG